MRNCHNCGNMLDATQIFCEKCGADVSKIIATASVGADAVVSNAAKPQKKLPVVVLSILLALLLVLCVVFLIGWQDEKGTSNYYIDRYYQQNNEISDLKAKVGGLEKQINELNLEKNSLENQTAGLKIKADFLDKYVVVVPDNGTNLYHKYGCEDLDITRFWAYNVEAAKNTGYTPHSKCTN